MPTRYEIHVEFPKPIVGLKTHYTFSTTTLDHPGPRKRIRWDCFTLNFWFTSGTGTSWAAAVQYAVRRLRAIVEPDTKITIIERRE